MAIRFTHIPRPVFVAAALLSTALIAPTIASATPSAPRSEPSTDSVQKQLGALAVQNSQLVEKYDHARVLVVRRQQAAGVASVAARKANADYANATIEYATNVQGQYESGALGAASALLESNNGPNYIDRLNTLNLISSHDADVVSQVTATRSAAATQARKTASMLAAAKKERDGLAAKKDAVDKQIKKYQNLLATLNSAQQYAYQRAANPAVKDVTSLKLPSAGSKAAQAAVKFALDQVGKPYVFGAAGPGTYDCSGLTLSAWRRGGVQLPHSAADQYNYGHRVPRGQLAPGDLVFFYQPIGHVAIYIGDGMMVSAPTEGQNVSVVPLGGYNSDYVGATRLG